MSMSQSDALLQVAATCLSQAAVVTDASPVPCGHHVVLLDLDGKFDALRFVEVRLISDPIITIRKIIRIRRPY